MTDHAPPSVLQRVTAVPALIGDPGDMLIVAGLAGTARDIASLTHDGDNAFILGGAMGAAVMIGLGLALARPDRRVLVVTGDGELLMQVGALATVGIVNPTNLSIVCVDNGHYAETGLQKSHTSHGVDLEKIASGSGIRATRTVRTEDEIAGAARLLRESNSTSFVLLKVTPDDAPKLKRNLDATVSRTRFRRAVLAMS